MPEGNGAPKEPYVSKSFSSSLFGTAKKYKLSSKEAEDISHTIENNLSLQEDDVPELANENVVKEVQQQTKEKILPPHLTYSVPDKKFQEPVSKNLKFPEGMHAYAGDESGSIEASFKHREVYATTDIGFGYRKNEDGIFVDENSGTMVLTDGVGSIGSGEVASALAAYGSAQLLKEASDFPLKEMPTALHKTVREYQKHNGPRCKEANATLAAARVSKDKKTVEFVHVGDSKALLIRNGELVYSSQDDNLTSFMMVSRGITKSEAEDLIIDSNHKPDSIVQSLGNDANGISFKPMKTSDTETNPHHISMNVKKGDVVLLCSDGLSDTLSPQQIAAYVQGKLREKASVKEIVEGLKTETIELMKQGRGKFDNISIAATII